MNTPYVVSKRQKLALTCTQCEYGDDRWFDSHGKENRRCVRCMEGSKKSFVLLKSLRDAKQGEQSREDDREYEEIMR